MTYLYNKDVNILNGGTVVSTSNRFPVTGDMTGSVTIVPESPATKITAFGEPLAITLTPVIQLDGVYGVTSDVIQTYSNGTGAGAGSGTAAGTARATAEAGSAPAACCGERSH